MYTVFACLMVLARSGVGFYLRGIPSQFSQAFTTVQMLSFSSRLLCFGLGECEDQQISKIKMVVEPHGKDHVLWSFA